MAPTELPLFPLPIALFPGAQQPLHIFETRYRQLLRDCLDGDRRFGLSLLPSDRPDRRPQPGDVGGCARITSHQMLPDGRAHILAVGESRFVIDTLRSGDHLYEVATVTSFEDDPVEPGSLAELSAEVTRRFTQVVRALGNPTTLGPSPDPVLPQDPTAVSYAVAAALDVELALKDRLLRLTSTEARLGMLRHMLRATEPQLKRRAAVQQRARRNGHAPTAAEAD